MRVITAARKIATRPPYDGDKDISAKAYHTLRTEASLGGEPVAVRVVVKEDVNGQFHYDMTVHAVDAVFDSANKEGRDESRPSRVTSANGGGTDPSRIARHQLDAESTMSMRRVKPAGPKSSICSSRARNPRWSWTRRAMAKLMSPRPMATGGSGRPAEYRCAQRCLVLVLQRASVSADAGRKEVSAEEISRIEAYMRTKISIP